MEQCAGDLNEIQHTISMLQLLIAIRNFRTLNNWKILMSRLSDLTPSFSKQNLKHHVIVSN